MSADAESAEYKNEILKRIGPEAAKRLGLVAAELPVATEVEQPWSAATHVTFLEAGMASKTVSLLGGRQIEVGLFGREIMLGASSLVGAKRGTHRAFMQIPGHGFIAPLEQAKKEFQRNAQFASLCMRCLQAELMLSSQLAACNVTHTIEQRQARWMLMCADRVGSVVYELSQDFLASMLGVSRPRISFAASALKEQGIVDYSRGVVHVRDIHRLKQIACECYGATQEHFNYLFAD